MDGLGPEIPEDRDLTEKNREVKLSIIIVHYNTSADLDRCLESIGHCPPLCDYRVVVVDNASSDPGLEAVRNRHADARWIMNDQNAGYSRAVNQGLDAEDAEFSLVLNPDIVVLPRSIDILLERAEANPRAGILGAQLLNTDGTIQDSCRRFYTFTTLLMRRTPLGRIFPGHKSVDRHLMRDFDHLGERAVDWVLGACMLVRRSAVDRVGAMDERFFLYFEDVDWCWRMGRAGFDVLYVPDARMEHRHRRESAGGMARKSFWMHLGSLISFYEKWGMLVYLLKRWRDPVQTLLLWLVDITALNLAFAGAYVLRGLMNPLFPAALYPFSEYRPLQIFATLLTSASFALMGRYRPGAARRRTPRRVWAQQVGTISLLLLASTWLSHQSVYSRAVLLLFIPLFAGVTLWAEKVYIWISGRFELGHLALERTIFVGSPSRIGAWLDDSRRTVEAGLDPVGYLLPATEGAAGRRGGVGDLPCLGTAGEIVDVVERYHAAQVIFWNWPSGDLRELRSLSRLRGRRIRLRWLVPEARLMERGARADGFAGEPSIVLDPDSRQMPLAVLDRAVGFAGGLLLVLVSWPIMFLGRSMAGWRVLDRRVCARASGDRSMDLKLTVDRRGRARPLPAQFHLCWNLMRGRISLVGPPLAPDGARTPGGLRDAWRLDAARPGLVGNWTGRGLSSRIAGFWTNPAGIASLGDQAVEETL